MKRILPLLSLLIPAMAFPFTQAQATFRTFDVEGRLRVTVPEAFEYGVPFPARVEVLEAPEEPQTLALSFNYLKEQGLYGGVLEPVQQSYDVAGSGEFPLELVVSEEKSGLTVALLTAYLSPDGSWKNRTMQAVVPILAPGADAEIYAGAVERAEKQSALAAAPTAPPSSADGGASVVEGYDPRESYFAQREDRPDLRKWEVTPQQLPPLEEILARPGADRPVYGVYCWANEYAEAHEEVARIGITSVRLSGPWDEAGTALEAAAKHGVEVMFTATGGSTWENIKTRRRPDFGSDEAFIAAVGDNIKAFLREYGPGGRHFAALGMESPIKALEVLNEPNFQYMIPDSDDRKADEAAREALYPKVLKAGYEAVKEICPGLPVVGFSGGGAASGDVRFIKRIHERHPEIVEYYDILSTHPYTHGAPPEARKIKSWGGYSIADNLHDILGGIPVEKPVWYTELGWRFSETHGGQHKDPKNALEHMVTPDLHAAYLVRMYLYAMRLGVGRVHVMHLHDADNYNGGLMTRNSLEWRPAAHAIRHLTRLMPHPKLTGAVVDGVEGVHIYTFDPDHTAGAGGQVIAAWNVAGPKTVSIPVEGSSVVVSDLVGNRKELPVSEGKVEIEIGPYPLFLE